MHDFLLRVLAKSFTPEIYRHWSEGFQGLLDLREGALGEDTEHDIKNTYNHKV